MAPERPGNVMFPTSTRISSIPIFLLPPPIGGCRQPSFSSTPFFSRSEIDENQIDERRLSTLTQPGIGSKVQCPVRSGFCGCLDTILAPPVGIDFDESSATRADKEISSGGEAGEASEHQVRAAPKPYSAGVPALMVTLNWPLPLGILGSPPPPSQRLLLGRCNVLPGGRG
ncbi:hypothetical protein CDEST_06018 [Colletotrichum destructivum]|uniref:Uncharacterized protein n=1 Tax=Colletotrichum destructivum TaxID=34406 RepID=A0AAX4ICC4_9PEZI|nr:hypothetical protein CDEST_06018 [Colletotrichum destructivum]